MAKNPCCSCFGNILWVIFGGLEMFLFYFIFGLVLCCTIVGIAFGIQVWKLAFYTLWPFGKKVVATDSSSGCLATIMNILWFFLGGLVLAMLHCLLGIIFCITIIGIPFGTKHFSMAALIIYPFGKHVIDDDVALLHVYRSAA